jgi:anti-sigma B factor antagonist
MGQKVTDPQLALFEPSGYITAANVSKFQEQLTEIVSESGCSMFLVDMSQVEFLDSAGLMALVTAFRLAGSLGKSFNICAIPPSVKIIFELTQLDRALSIFSSREEFEGSLGMEMAA